MLLAPDLVKDHIVEA